MSDNRVAVQHEHLWLTAATELKWVVELEKSTWQAIASAAGMEFRTLRNDVISAAHISFHFMWRRILEPSGDLPWRLVRGDIQENLRVLKEGPCPDEPFSKNLWTLGTDGTVPESHLIEVVRLMGEAGWTSLVCEQQHGSLAQLRRHHPEYIGNTLICRALMHQMVKLLPSTSPMEKKVDKLTKKMLTIAQKKNPAKTNSVSMLMQSLVKVVMKQKACITLVFCFLKKHTHRDSNTSVLLRAACYVGGSSTTTRV